MNRVFIFVVKVRRKQVLGRIDFEKRFRRDSVGMILARAFQSRGKVNPICRVALATLEIGALFSRRYATIADGRFRPGVQTPG
ncbi:MAG: hypothetical protein ABI923_11945 [bacterium]